jgi:hypothetical protein
VVHLAALPAIRTLESQGHLAAKAVEPGRDDLAAGRARRKRLDRQLGELVRESPHVELLGRDRIARRARRPAAPANAASRVPPVNFHGSFYHPTKTS